LASIRKRQSKWHVQVRRSGQSRTRTFTHKTDAEVWARKTEREIDTGEIRAVADRLKTVTVGDLLRRYRDEVIPKKRSAASIELYIVDRFIEHPMSFSSLAAFSPAAVTRFRDERLRQVKGSTVVRDLGVLRHCFEVARKDWGIPLKTNPVAEITMPSVGRPRERRITEAELSALKSRCTHPLLWSVITIAIETGMRRGEIVNMKWSDIDWDLGTLHIPTTKNGHPRTIPLTPMAMETLKSVTRDGDLVFPMTGNAVRLAWERLKKRAGVVDLRFHDLRHEAVSRFFEMGLSVPEVALISGHRDLRMLHRYTHLKAEKVGEKIRMLASQNASVSPSESR
jgi:integrase